MVIYGPGPDVARVVGGVVAYSVAHVVGRPEDIILKNLIIILFFNSHQS